MCVCDLESVCVLCACGFGVRVGVRFLDGGILLLIITAYAYYFTDIIIHCIYRQSMMNVTRLKHLRPHCI